MKTLLTFNDFINISESTGGKFFSFLGDYVDTDYYRNITWAANERFPYRKMQKYKNKRDNRFLNVLYFIYQGGGRGRLASEVSRLLQSWGLSGGGNILYATEWNWEDEEGSRRTGLFAAHCTKIDGRWVLTDNKLKKYFSIQDAIDEGASQEEIDHMISLLELGIDMSTKSKDIDLDQLDLRDIDFD